MKIERAARLNRHGSVLLHVLVTSVLVALISATLLRMSLFRYQMAGRGAHTLVEKRDDSAALAAVIGVWNANNSSCSGAPAGWNVTTAGSAGNCNCSYWRPPSAGPPVINRVDVTASGAAPSCTLTILSTNLN